jgi:ataxin-3
MMKQKKVYWERQGSDKLCGVHCINSLLQGPYFTEFELATLAQELDAKEQQIMQEQGMTADYYKFMKVGTNQYYNESESNNVALDGNFSI